MSEIAGGGGCARDYYLLMICVDDDGADEIYIKMASFFLGC